MDPEFHYWWKVAADESERKKEGEVIPGGPIGTAKAFDHYKKGSGEVRYMDIENMPLGEVRPADFPEVQRLLRIYRGKEAIVEVEDSKSVKTSYWDRFTLGSISVVLKGVFTSNIRGWKFERHLEGGEGDDYDFNLDVPNRTWLEEKLTELGSRVDGQPYKIIFTGRKPLYAHGNW